MACASCGRANRPGAKFCGGCGRPLVARCPACGSEHAEGARFCDACGASLAAASADASASRKIVTIVFADLIGSTALHERLDAESARLFMERYYAAMRGAVEAHGGRVTQLLGDGVKAVFGAPRVTEDDALRAVRAGVAMQRAFRELADAQRASVGRTGLRVAVNTGEVVAEGASEIIGDPVNVAARLQEEARDGDVVIGEATRRLVEGQLTLEPLGSFALKGRSEAVAAHRVVSLERPAGAAASAFVGREPELARLIAVYTRACGEAAARLALVLGSPGLGKSRLLDELALRLGGDATLLSAHCDAAGGATFAPLADALRRRLRIEEGASGESLRAAILAALPGEESERARIASGIAALIEGAATSPEEIFFVVRRLFAAFATARPVVLVIDDLQWAEPLLLDLLEHLVQWGGGVRLLVLAAARPELRDLRSSLATPGGLAADVVTLSGLDAGAAARLAANVIGADALPAAIAGRVLATSEGNPLFVGELVRMLVHDGALVREGDRWTTGVAPADVEMPPTIHALLAARIERLSPEDRSVLERAAVIGRHFSRAALVALLPFAPGEIDARLEALRRSELIESDTGWFLGEPALRFHHVLIRDAAYRRLLKHTRADLHVCFADWLAARGASAGEHDETLGWHLEQAHEHLRELGPLDAPARALGERAARHLAAAGRRALARDDLALAAGLLGRALARLETDDPARAELALDACEALLSAGDVGPAARAVDELARFASGSDRLRAWHACLAGQLAVLRDPQALRATADAVAAAAASLASLGDAAGEAKGHSVHALALARLGKIGGSEAALDKALAAARRARDRRRANAVLAGAPLASLWGPSPVTRASGRCLDVVRVLRITQGAPAVEAVSLRCQAVLEALRGRVDAARRMVAASRQLVEELGITQRLLEADVFAGMIELLDGGALEAERLLRGAWEGLRAQGLGIDAAHAAALLGRALLAQGRGDEAEAVSRESEALAGDDFKAAISWRGVRAEALARRGEHAEALALAHAAVELAAATDDLLDHADARMALAAVLRAAGREVEADGEERRAVELWEAKGATLLVERARGEQPGKRAAPARSDGPAAGAARPQRRLRANAATANAALAAAAITARDEAAFPQIFADEFEALHHPTETRYGRDGALATFRAALGARDVAYRIEPLAALGGSLALFRQTFSASGVDIDEFEVGANERRDIILNEVDASGRRWRSEWFAPDRLGDGVARLYERHADLLVDEIARRRAAATARSVAVYMATEIDAISGAITPDVEFVDHRVLGFPPVRGADLYVRGLRSLLDVARAASERTDDVLDARPDALLVRRLMSGTDGASGGAYEIEFLQILIFAGDGLVERVELFEASDVAAAFARFDSLLAQTRTGRSGLPSGGAPPRIENAATRADDAIQRAWEARDWPAFSALWPPHFASVDRRRLMRLELDRDTMLEAMRPFFGKGFARVSRLLATRGDRLALHRVTLSGSDGVSGPSEVEVLQLSEADASGARCLAIGFDPADEAAARLELDARHDSGEAAPFPGVSAGMREFSNAFAARDWDALAGRCAPEIEVHDRRRLGWESLHGPAAYVAALRSLVELAPDTKLRLDHAEICARGYLVVTVWVGTREGGAYEAPSLMVAELDADGRIRRFDQYDVDRLDEAKARYAELRDGPPRVAPNAASRAMDRWRACAEAKDLDGIAALLAPGFRFEDRRSLIRDSGNREKMLESIRVAMGSGARCLSELLATAGERLVLERLTFVLGGGAGTRAEIETLQVSHVDAAGLFVAAVTFDPDDLHAARVELSERLARGDAGS